MNILTISLANLRFRKLGNFFNITILALGIAIIITLLHLSQQIEQRFQRDLSGIDLVVGGKGSPIQLILSSVFQIDIPTGNIPLEEAEKLEKNPLVKSAIPISIGDNYNGFRIVGTTPDYIIHYNGKIAEGQMFASAMDVVLGSEVAKQQKSQVGDKIVGAHGLVNSDDLHSDFPYNVTGILAPTGTVLDRLVLTPVESVWNVHEQHHDDDKEEAENHEHHHDDDKEEAENHEHHHDDDKEEAENHEHHHDDDKDEAESQDGHQEKEITSLLISYETPMAAVTLPRLVNKTSSMQAASPAFELARLLKIIGVGSDGIKLFAGLLILIAAFGFFVTLWNAVNDRSYDIALMRSLGATRNKILCFVITEGLILGVLGTILGLILGHIFAAIAQISIEQNHNMVLNNIGIQNYEIYIALSALIISLVASVIPAFTAYKVNIGKMLSKGV